MKADVPFQQVTPLLPDMMVRPEEACRPRAWRINVPDSEDEKLCTVSRVEFIASSGSLQFIRGNFSLYVYFRLSVIVKTVPRP